MSKSQDEIIRDRACMEWSAAAPGWKKYGKDMFTWMAPISHQLIKSAGISIGQTVLDVATGTGQPALTIAKIVGHNGLMFMPDPLKALKAFHRVLKPGGKASVTVWGSTDKSPVMTAVMKTISKHVPPDLEKQPPTVAPSDNPGGAFSISSVDMLRDYFLKTGFSNFNADKIEVTVAQTDTAEQLWQGMTEVTGFLVLLLSKLPDEKKLAIKNDVIESLSKLFSSSGPVKLTGELILGTALKPAQFQSNMC